MAVAEIDAAGEIDHHRALAAVEQGAPARSRRCRPPGAASSGTGASARPPVADRFQRRPPRRTRRDGPSGAATRRPCARARRYRPPARCGRCARRPSCRSPAPVARPGALRLPGRWPARNSAGSRTSSTYSVRSGSSSNRSRSSGPITPTPDASAKRFARSSASASGLRRAGIEPLGAAAVAAQAGEFPAHRAVAQRHHLVGDAGAPQALGAQDAARAAGAVHHHQRLRIGHDVADAIRQFAARHADAGGDRHAREFLVRAAVQHHHVAAGVDPLLQLAADRRFPCRNGVPPIRRTPSTAR